MAEPVVPLAHLPRGGDCLPPHRDPAVKLGRWLLFGLWTIGSAGFFLAGDPSLTGEAALRLLRGLGGVFVWAVAALGAGPAVVGWATPALRTDPRGWAHAAVAGLLLWGLGGLGLAALGMLNPVVAGAAMALSSVSVVSNSLLLRRWRPLPPPA